ncbi:MAG: response regulator [Oscillochloris sp.]|nr:response regulator [Oscillochloris sp.]
MSDSRTTILIADDDPAIQRLLTILLGDEGYTVIVADNGVDLIQLAQSHLPDLILIDVMMPLLDGYEAVRQLRADTRTAHTPMLILTAHADAHAVVNGFESGADDFVSKPFQSDELLARIRRLLRRATQRPVRSPLTGLAGNILLTEEIGYRLRRAEPFVVLYVDLNHFKVFNDTYGFARGDRMIRMLANVITGAVATAAGERDFIGHIGGDDFAVITDEERLQQICRTIIRDFDLRAPDLYDPEDRTRGYVEGHDREGNARRFGILSVAIGGIRAVNGQFPGPDDVGRAAAAMKQRAKAFATSHAIVDSISLL